MVGINSYGGHEDFTGQLRPLWRGHHSRHPSRQPRVLHGLLRRFFQRILPPQNPAWTRRYDCCGGGVEQAEGLAFALPLGASAGASGAAR